MGKAYGDRRPGGENVGQLDEVAFGTGRACGHGHGL
jgi:hypothetical protein